MTVAANRVELLQIADAVAREKMISREVVIRLLEEAIERAARSVYGLESDIRASIHPLTGHVELIKVKTVVPDGDVPSATEINLVQAKEMDPSVEIGGTVQEELPAIDFGRIAAQSARQVIMQKLKEAEKEGQWEDFKDRVGENIHGSVRQVNRDARPPGRISSVVVELSRGEGIIMGSELIPRENPRVGDPIRAYIYDVKKDQKAHQVFLSRSRPEFVANLFAQEVPEVYDGSISIKAVARDPGSRSKVAVVSNDPNIDPVGSCVGLGGSRVRAVTKELQGEKIDIVLWDQDPAMLVINAVPPKIEITKLVVDEERCRIELIVPESDLPVVIGRGGQATRLLSRLTGYDVRVLTDSEESQKRDSEAQENFKIYKNVLGLEDETAQDMMASGFNELADVAHAQLEDLTAVLGSQDQAREVQKRAAIYLKEMLLRQEARKLGVEDELLSLVGPHLDQLTALAEAGVNTVEAFAGLIPDDLLGYEEAGKHVAGILEGLGPTREEATEMIMKARETAGLLDDKRNKKGIS